MKLLICVKCNSVFNLKKEVKTCTCGESKGNYLEDGLNAEYEGPCLPLGFKNSSLTSALKEQPADGFLGKEFVAFVIQRKCPTMIKRDEHYWNDKNKQPKPYSIMDHLKEVENIVNKNKSTPKLKKKKTLSKRKSK